MLRGSRFYGGDYLLKYIIHKQDHDAGEDHDYADDAVQGNGAGAVCDGGGNLRPKERENDAENEACDIRHAADGEVADATGQRSERHDEHTGANRHVHLIAEERRQNEQQHHAAARADEATDKPDEDTADDGFDEAFLRRSRGHLLFGRFDRL